MVSRDENTTSGRDERRRGGDAGRAEFEAETVSDGNRGTVVVVEDEEDTLDLLRYWLERAGYTVETFTTGTAALSYFESADTPLLVTLDIMLPGMSGVEVLQRMRDDLDLTDVPVLLLTAKGDEQSEVGGIQSGATEYIRKPFSPRVLLAHIERYVD